MLSIFLFYYFLYIKFLFFSTVNIIFILRSLFTINPYTIVLQETMVQLFTTKSIYLKIIFYIVHFLYFFLGSEKIQIIPYSNTAKTTVFHFILINSYSRKKDCLNLFQFYLKSQFSLACIEIVCEKVLGLNLVTYQMAAFNLLNLW